MWQWVVPAKLVATPCTSCRIVALNTTQLLQMMMIVMPSEAHTENISDGDTTANCGLSSDIDDIPTDEQPTVIDYDSFDDYDSEHDERSQCGSEEDINWVDHSSDGRRPQMTGMVIPNSCMATITYTHAPPS